MMDTYSVEQALLSRAGNDELLLLKRTYPDGSYFYALAHLADAETQEYVAIPASQRRVSGPELAIAAGSEFSR